VQAGDRRSAEVDDNHLKLAGGDDCSEAETDELELADDTMTEEKVSLVRAPVMVVADELSLVGVGHEIVAG
jgi:hypothetical protein